MAKTPATLRLMFVGLTLATACGGDDLLPPPVGDFGDGGFGGRPVADGAGDVRMGDARGDGPQGNLPQGLTVKVSIASPVPAAVIKRADLFEPIVTVDVVGLKPADLVGVESVSVVVKDPQQAMPGPAVQLGITANVVNGDAGAARMYTFGDVAVPVADLPSGVYELIATATMVGGVQVSEKTTFQIDAGPTITFTKPSKPDTSFKASTRIEVSIVDALFGPIKDVEMLLGTTALEVSEVGDQQYASDINFSSFNPPLSGRQLVTVRARNANGTLTVASRSFLADDQGPVFTMLKPERGQLVGGIIQISAIVEDPAGVKPDSVIAVIANGSEAQFEVRLDPPPIGAMTQLYSKLFDAKQLPNNAIFPTISFRAADNLGNESSEGYLLSFDKTPPLLDLDPPDDFRFLVDFSNKLRCSWPTDPVGPDAVDDGQLVNQAFDVRVRAEDQGNQVLSGSIDFVPIAGLKNVQLLVLDDTTRPLVVDTDDDARCDAVNPTLVPTTRPMNANDVLLLNLQPLAPTGTPDNFPETPDPGCFSGGLTGEVKPVCGEIGPTHNPWKARRSEMGTLHGHFMSAFAYYTQSRLPSIWTPGPIAEGVECAGRQLEAVGSNLSDGWICLAAVGEDQLGQKQVSRPIRVCVDKDGNGQECPHLRISAVTATTPVAISTTKPHGLTSGDEVYVQGVLCDTHVNGRKKITVTAPDTFTIDGSQAEAACAPMAAWALPFKLMPDCTGKQTHKEPTPMVNTAPCAPWRLFPRGEFRKF